MWFFNCPEIVHGEDALDYLEELPGHKAFIVTDARLHQLGFTTRIQKHLQKAGADALWLAAPAGYGRWPFEQQFYA